MVNIEQQLLWLLDNFELEDLFEHLDIEPIQVLEILIYGGYVELPPYLENEDGQEQSWKEDQASELGS